MKIGGRVTRFSVVFRHSNRSDAQQAEMMNVPRWGLWSILGAYLMAVSLALPSSLVDEIKSSEMRNNKGELFVSIRDMVPLRNARRRDSFSSWGSMKRNKYIKRAGDAPFFCSFFILPPVELPQQRQIYFITFFSS
ncbi:hypothetical protein GWI33_010725 [Rhynchophorus ferrugineus]|uniref:Uncharacterized protein n=1 Tax=Rhynchophorus ferrugineus TaxID=354439 RepID=A0A834IC22_RHYFE|nr:hypothetical protein GWI33_010725 [Rhynchophorus ferrugineus]